MLKQRIITALILAAIVIGVILQEDTLWTILLFSLGLLIATRELLQLTLKLHDWLVWILAAIFAVIFYFTAPLNPQIVFLQSAIATGVWILIAGGLMLYRHHGNQF